ncbi:hypothetical protein [Nocardia sp. NBC_00511]|uniref:hypothetical protein n=1 Tax=Nocardia sp. NBC_00511 TaxID=2903591 RepID=UPI0030DF5303
MTDYFRSMAAYVATQNVHSRTDTDRPGQAMPHRVATPDKQADSGEDTPDIQADKGWTR